MYLKPGCRKLLVLIFLTKKISLDCALHLFFITENIWKTFKIHLDKYYQYKTIVDIATVNYDLIYICTATSCKQRFKDYSVCL